MRTITIPVNYLKEAIVVCSDDFCADLRPKDAREARTASLSRVNAAEKMVDRITDYAFRHGVVKDE